MSQAMHGLHVLEGFFGRPWPWEARVHYASFLMEAGYTSYIYAPKDDAYLRRRWQEPWPDDTPQRLADLADAYHAQRLEFGVGLSPFEIYRNFNSGAKEKLKAKIAELNAFGVDALYLLFDDMRGDSSNLASTQADIAHFVAEHSAAQYIVMCPTYYSDDPILEKVFGPRPVRYWEDLGALLDSNIDLFWTGPKVCTDAYAAAHMRWICDVFGRKPFLWDNYPVNDGAKTSQFLNLRAYTGRDALQGCVCGHAVNPMNQPHLSKIALSTLRASYDEDGTYNANKAFSEACLTLGGEVLLDALTGDLSLLQDQGLDTYSTDRHNEMYSRYKSLVANDAAAAPYATEVIDWLRGEYAFDPACLTG